MKNILKILIGWLFYLGSICLTFFLDFRIRRAKGLIERGINSDGTPIMELTPIGIPEALQVLIILFFSSIAFYFIYKGTKIKSKYIKMLILTIQIAIGGIIFIVSSFWYVLGTGVDSL